MCDLNKYLFKYFRLQFVSDQNLYPELLQNLQHTLPPGKYKNYAQLIKNSCSKFTFAVKTTTAIAKSGLQENQIKSNDTDVYVSKFTGMHVYVVITLGHSILPSNFEYVKIY